jgi:predicted nucleotidyltransferase
MTEDSNPQEAARPASVADLKLLLTALNTHGVDYLLIGGYALYALGYQRGTVDIDIVLRPTLEQGQKVKQALLLLPDGVAKDIDPAWFPEGDTIRVADAFVVDLMFNACGESYDSLQPHAVTVDFDGVPLRTVNLEGLLKTKQSSREKDQMDRMILERALAASKKLL